jgi:hypothetical protein
MRRTPLPPALLLLLPLLPACPSGDDDDGTPTEEPIPEAIDATLRLADYPGGAVLAGATLSAGGAPETSDPNGYASFVIPSQDPFEILVTADGYAQHRLQGRAGIQDFQLQVPMGTEEWGAAVYGGLGIVPDPERGTLLVLLDTVAFQAAIGASVDIEAEHGDPFIFVGDVAEFGNELIFDSDRLLIFPNVVPGTTEVDVTDPEEDVCLGYPSLDAGDDFSEATITAGSVTVVGFLCQ